MTVGFVGGVFWTTWKGGLDALSLYTYFSLAALFQEPLRAQLANVKQFLLQSARRLFNHICAISLHTEEREAPTIGSETLKKKPLTTENAQISVNNLPVLALATKNQVNFLDDVRFDITTASLNIIISPVGCGKSTLLCTLLVETILSSGAIHIRRDNMAFCHQNA
ncbi:hypothetical protein BPAE_0026g00020 [Botrytis paeoniae]|uniref:Uncharacterized protein n=1 Tax=Botrytis paeoniae TaxID=278948 RepID=A0A4Z1FUM1_9HELO|nr:hypothetical protein BPAE_0026g00020 [Botrytis paeoniae]